MCTGSRCRPSASRVCNTMNRSVGQGVVLFSVLTHLAIHTMVRTVCTFSVVISFCTNASSNSWSAAIRCCGIGILYSSPLIVLSSMASRPMVERMYDLSVSAS